METNLGEARSTQTLNIDRNQPTERPSKPRGPGRGSNLSEQDRVRGGEHSARIQVRDAHGHFAGLSRNPSGPQDSRSSNENSDGKTPRPKQEETSSFVDEEADVSGECVPCSIVEQSGFSGSSKR